MPLDWAEPGGNALLGYDLHVDATDPLDPILQLTRVEGYIPTEPWHEEVTRTTVVARADGPVLHALFGHHYWKTSADETKGAARKLLVARREAVLPEGSCPTVLPSPSPMAMASAPRS
jgi:hypothetical protein